MPLGMLSHRQQGAGLPRTRAKDQQIFRRDTWRGRLADHINGFSQVHEPHPQGPHTQAAPPGASHKDSGGTFNQRRGLGQAFSRDLANANLQL